MNGTPRYSLPFDKLVLSEPYALQEPPRPSPARAGQGERRVEGLRANGVCKEVLDALQ